MKRLFTLAIIAMIASLSFAQAPAQVKKAAPKAKMEKVMKTADMQKAMQMKAAKQAKAQAADVQSTSMLRHAAKPSAMGAQKQMTPAKVIKGAQVTRPAPLGQYKMSQFKNKKGVVTVEKVTAPGKVKNNTTVARTATPKTGGETVEVEAIDAAATYYDSDGDWYCVLKDADNNLFYFDIVTNNPAPLEIGHEYTLADMDPSYSLMKVGSKMYIYSSATFTPKQGQYGTDYEATCVLASDGTAYHITYTAPELQTVDVEATNAAVKWYGAPDNDWYINLYNENFEFQFDIPNQSADGLILDHEYTLADMDVNYSWGKNKATGVSINYQSVSFKATTGANGTDYAVTVVDKKGNTYNVKYTTVAPPPVTETVELEFSADETDLVDAASTMGLIQFVGSKEETGLEAYVGLHATQVAGEYTFEDVEGLYTSIYLSYTDATGVQCADLTGTVTDLGEGAYKAYFEYLGTNGTLYKLTYNYGETGDPTGGVKVTKNANGIITSVEGGESKTYTREGTAYFVQSGSMYYGAQEGVATIIEDAANGKVYIKDPISRYTQGSWVEGSIEEGKIVVAAKQPLAYSDQYGATISLRWGLVDAEGNINAADAHADNFVYVIDGDKLVLQGTESFATAEGDAYFMGAFWDDDNSATGYGDAETVLTYDPEYVGPSYDLVELPDGAQTADWYLNGSKVSNSSTTAVKNQAIKTAFVGDDVYVQGLFADMPNSWVKGTISGSDVTFAKGQYLGKYGTNDIWFMGVAVSGQTAELVDVTAAYDAEKKEITLATDILANAKPDAVYYLSWLQDVVLSKDAKQFEEPTITTLTATLPYANSFDTEAEQAEAAIYDANEDGKTFTFADDSKSGSTTARYTYSSTNKGDDYVVFPGLELKAGTSYKVSVDARPYGASYPERLEVVAGTEAKASKLNIPVIPATEVATADYETLTADFTPEADGVYYFAIHGISDADMFYLYTDNFSVKENNLNAPKTVTDATVTPDEAAALKAEIKFTAPSQTLAGEAITAEANLQVKISRNGELIKTEAVAPGTQFGYTDEAIEKPGTYTWSIVAVVGELQSDAVTVKAYVGEDIPDDVENLTAADLNGKVGLSWDAPVDGVNGGIIIPENLKYNVYPVEMIEFWGMTFPDIDFENPYATGVKDTSYEVEYDTNEGAQGYTYFGVTAENTAGETNGAMAAVLTGAPYELPFVETLPGGSLSYWWGADYDDAIYEAEGGLGIGTNADGTHNFTFDAKAAGWIELMSGKISLNGADAPALTFSHKALAECALQVQIITPEGEEPDPSMLTVNTEEQTATIDLSIYADQPWIRFNLIGNFEEPNMLAVSNVIVMNMVQHDLEIAVSAPASVTAGKAATVKATVKNVGQTTASDYQVKFYVNEVEAPAPMFEILPLAFMETAEFEFELETSIFDEAGDVTVKAEVVYDADENPENDADETVVSIVAPSATPVASIDAVQNEEGNVVVTWTVSENTAQEVTEDFESYEVGITPDGATMGPWSAIDGDKGMTYGWSSESIAWPYTGELYAFGIMNFPSVFGTATDIEATSGEQALMFMSVTDEQGDGLAADDWFISPELPGMAQTISFKARPMTMNYGPETLEVMASENGQTWTKVASFELDNENAFDEYSANLAEGTKFFALHYVSNDIFCAFVDDLKYTVGGGAPTAFNIYVDQNLVGEAAAEARTYTIEDELSDGEHEISVTAVYTTAESAPKSTILNTTGIQNIIVDGAKAEIYTVNGVRVQNANKPGVYVINGRKAVVK